MKPVAFVREKLDAGRQEIYYEYGIKGRVHGTVHSTSDAKRVLDYLIGAASAPTSGAKITVEIEELKKR